MKILYVVFFLFAGTPFYSLGQQLVFSYDVAGNQERREWICINCRPANTQEAMLKTVSVEDQQLVAEREKELIAVDELVHGWVKASPNPVNEILQVSWRNSNERILQGISIYTINGSRVFASNYGAEERSAEVSFASLPSAIYILLVQYIGGKKETIKIIKK